jgi:glycosyltransferase involved in cell wall biosynthesis
LSQPRLIVFSSLFPNSVQPTAGLFIRERMFRVGKQLPLVVVSPKPWFPGQGLIRLFRPHYRPMPAKLENQAGFEVHLPRFLAIPGLFRGLDSLFMALGSYFTLRRLKARGHNLIDAHFAYPDGHAALRLGRWLNLPVTVTLRGTEVPQSRNPALVAKLREVFRDAARIITVSDSLRRLALSLGLAEERGQVVGNGVDADKFAPVPRVEARAWVNQRIATAGSVQFRHTGASRYPETVASVHGADWTPAFAGETARVSPPYDLPLTESAKVLITVGGLVERKGFHRVIACLPELLKFHPDLYYLVVGGPCPEGDMSQALKAQVASLGLEERVHFLGPVQPDELNWPLSAADVFVLSTRNEGWANVILEAMACGLPVVASDVGGNSEVVCRPELGEIVPFDDHAALIGALDRALAKAWDASTLRAYAEENSWDNRVEGLVHIFLSTLVSQQGNRKRPPIASTDAQVDAYHD